MFFQKHFTVMMIMIFIKVTITYFWLKLKIYLKKVPAMTNNTLTIISGVVHINPMIFLHL